MEILCTFGAFALTVAAHFLVTRTNWPGSSVMKYAALAAAGAACLTLVLWTKLTTSFFAGAACLVLFGFLCELYVFFFTMVSSSISATLMRKLRQRDMRLGEIEALYDSRGMVDRRLERMRSVGLLDPVTSRATRRGRRLVWAFGLLRRVFRFETQKTSGVA